MRHPVFFIACALLGGALAGRLVQPPEWFTLTVLAVLIVGACSVLRRTSATDPRGHDRARRLALASFFVVALLQQNREVVREQAARRQIESPALAVLRDYAGTVAGEPALRRGGERGGRMVLVLDAVDLLPDASSPGERLAMRVQLTVLAPAWTGPASAAPFRGQRIAFRAALRAPSARSFPGGFDPAGFLGAQGIGALGSVWRSDAFRRIPSEDRRFESALFAWLLRWRRGATGFLDAELSPRNAGLAQAMLLGDTGNLDPGLQKAFSRTGAVHLFSVSGLHTALVACMIYGLCRAFRLPRQPSALLLMVCLAAYAALVGFNAPVVRSAVMASCMALPALIRRRVAPLNALSIAASLTLLADPLALWRSDFQMSYLCVLGLILLYPALSELLTLPRPPRHSRRAVAVHACNRALGDGLAVCLAAQLPLVPLIAASFQQFPLVSFAANLVLVPFSSLLLYLGWAAALVAPVAADPARGLAAALDVLSSRFADLASVFSRTPGAVMHLPPFPGWLALGYYLVLFSGPHMRMERWGGAREVRRGRTLLRLGCIAALLAWWPLLAGLRGLQPGPDAPLHLTMIDVGQGDSFLLRTSDGRALLVDTGLPACVRTVLSTLRLAGVDELQALVLTHADADHSGGAAELIEQFPVREIWENTDAPPQEGRLLLAAAASRAGVARRPLQRGGSIAGFPDVRIEVLHPGPGPAAASDENRHSVVLRIRLGGVAFLLTGDADREVEEELLRRYGPDGLGAQILKVAHHGSDGATSDGFLRAVRPSLALLSVGARNSYGHPSPAVVERLRGAGVRVWSTACNGTVELRTDGRRLWVRPGRSAAPASSSGSKNRLRPPGSP